MKPIILSSGLCVAILTSAAIAAPPAPPASDLPPSWFGDNTLVVPHPTGSPTRYPNYQTTSTRVPWPAAPTHTNNIPAFRNLSAENAVAVAIVAPINATYVNNANATAVTNTSAIAYAAFKAVGYGTTGQNGTGPGSIGGAVGSGSGAQNLTTSANAASAAAILNERATDVVLSSNGTSNSTTFDTKNGPVTEAWAFSISEASDSQGDFAIAWAWAHSYISPQQNYTHGGHGGYIRGQASASAVGSGYGWGPGGWGPGFGGPGWNHPTPPQAQDFGRIRAVTTAGGDSADASAFDPRQPAADEAPGLSDYFFNNGIQSNTTGGGVSLANGGGNGVGTDSVIAVVFANGYAKPHGIAKAQGYGSPNEATASARA